MPTLRKARRVGQPRWGRATIKDGPAPALLGRNNPVANLGHQPNLLGETGVHFERCLPTLGEAGMADRNYWLDLFTAVTWKEFLDAGATVSGFRESRWNTLQKVKVGDYFLCYLTGVSRWIGLLEVTSSAFRDKSTIWKDDSFPCRVKVRVIAKLTPETGIPVKEMKDQLSVFQRPDGAWTGHFRGSPTKWKAADGEAVVKEVMKAAESPVVRPIDPARLKYRPKGFQAKIGIVTVPESEPAEEEQQPTTKEPAAHTEIQWLLLKLGAEMGFDVWVARNDRRRSFDGKRFSELPPSGRACRFNLTMPLTRRLS